MLDIKKIQKIGLLLNNSINESTLFDSIFNAISDSIEFNYATIFTLTDQNNLDPIYSKNDVVVDLASDFNIGNGSGIAGWVSDSDNALIFPHFMNENPSRKFNSFVSIPLIIDGNRIGVLNLGHDKIDYFKEEDKENFNSIGGQIAIILDKFNLKKEIETKTLELNQALKELQETKEKLNQKEKFAVLGEDAMAFNKEVNNPLSVIMGFSDLLLNKCKNGDIKPQILVEKLEIIIDSAHKINTIIHHFENSQLKN